MRGTDRNGLTRREREVIELVRNGKSDAAIAEALAISVRTAETHVGSALRKLGKHDRRTL